MEILEEEHKEHILLGESRHASVFNNKIEQVLFRISHYTIE